jgi:predicted transcriptional regulator
MNSPTPLARRTDPQESFDGAADVEERLPTMRLIAWLCVKRHPGCTCSELAEKEEMRDPRSIGRRLNELEKLGFIARLPARKCRVTGRNAATWIPVREWMSSVPDRAGGGI